MYQASRSAHRRLQVAFALCWLLSVVIAFALTVPAGFKPEKLAEMDAAITSAIAEHKLPGGVLWLERQGQVYHRAYGNRALEPAIEPMTEDTIFDFASLTKVVATTPAMMLLIERGQVKVDEPAHSYLPEFTGAGRENITIRHLMTHTSGLPASFTRGASDGYEGAIRTACSEKPTAPPGTIFRYSDVNFILLGEIVHRVARTPLEQFVAREIYQPLKMTETGYLPARAKQPRIAPTQQTGSQMLRGRVHDPKARAMGGVAGHAGVFSTAADLARYARMMLNKGELDGARLFKPETVELMTSVQSPEKAPARRGLGWDIDSGYSRPRGKLFPLGSYGHTGFTGTSIWIDPFSQTFWIFLSNRVHPDGQGNILPLQAALANLAAEAVEGFDFAHVPGALPPRTSNQVAVTSSAPVSLPSAARSEVLNGIDVLVKENFAPLKNLRIGLITNHTGHDRRRRPTIDLLKNAQGVALKVLFSPEHGIRGELDEKVGDSVDEKTGLPVYSLYGARRAPEPSQLEGLDALVFDIQDIGCRFYTYISTMGNCLEAAAKAKVKFIVLDRVDPIEGALVEGPIYHGAPSFTAYHSIPLRYGMTIGELARMLNAERSLHADLTVVQVEGWSRQMWFDQTGLPWTNPSPNIRSLTAATLYPGLGLHESALSVGRGTGTPFEVVGAPYIDDVAFAAELNHAGLAGLRFIPIRFTPTYSTFKDQPCGGAAILVTDRERVQAVDLGLAIALTLERLYPKEFAIERVNHLLQDLPIIEAIKLGKLLEEIKGMWAADLEVFNKRRTQYLIYK
jgi:uncharacterized protein YbbC (DUF1343 family)/CubicO group peptidase (beta-lactamase class C family)